MAWHGYILIRDIPAGWPQSNMWNGMHQIGRQSDPQPAHNNHMRISLDGRSAIVEALFDDAEITRDALITTIANAIGRNTGQVDASLNLQQMGGAGSTWAQSQAAVLAYLVANQAAWE